MSTHPELQKTLLQAGLNTLKAKPWTVLLARLFGTKHAIWKSLDDGSLALHLVSTWRGKQYLVRRLDV